MWRGVGLKQEDQVRPPKPLSLTHFLRRPGLLDAQILDMKKEFQEEEDNEATAAEEDQLEGMSAVIKTTHRQTIYLPIIGLVGADELRPGDLVGTNRDSYLVLEKLPPECVPPALRSGLSRS